MGSQLTTFLQAALAADDFPALGKAFDAFLSPLGVDAVIYTIDRYGYEPVKDSVGLMLYTFPPSLLENYLDKALYEDDPIIRRCQQSLLPFHWFDLEAEERLSATARLYLDALRDHGFIDGVALQVFGPTGIAAHFSFGARDAALTRDDVALRLLQSACHHMHVRTLELQGRAGEIAPLLSAREKEVLQWVARGKSNAVIAEILGVSPHTVDTVMRRAFTKLSAANRISAVLKAASMGLITV